MGATSTLIPCLDFREPDSCTLLEQALSELSSFELIAFTSANGVRFFFQYLKKRNIPLTRLQSFTFACVGPKTSKTLQDLGLRANITADKHIAEGLSASIEAYFGGCLLKRKVLLPQAQIARGVLLQRLTDLGAHVVKVPCYKTVCPTSLPAAYQTLDRNATLLFSSPSAVTNWVKLTKDVERCCYCIGPVTAKAAQKEGFKILQVATTHTVEGLLDALHVEGK